MKKYVIDTSALVAFFNDEPVADVVEGLLNDAASGVCAITMNKYNLLEAYYGYLRANARRLPKGYSFNACGSYSNIGIITGLKAIWFCRTVAFLKAAVSRV